MKLLILLDGGNTLPLQLGRQYVQPTAVGPDLTAVVVNVVGVIEIKRE